MRAPRKLALKANRSLGRAARAARRAPRQPLPRSVRGDRPGARQVSRSAPPSTHAARSERAGAAVDRLQRPRLPDRGAGRSAALEQQACRVSRGRARGPSGAPSAPAGSAARRASPRISATRAARRPAALECGAEAERIQQRQVARRDALAADLAPREACFSTSATDQPARASRIAAVPPAGPRRRRRRRRRASSAPGPLARAGARTVAEQAAAVLVEPPVAGRVGPQPRELVGREIPHARSAPHRCASPRWRRGRRPGGCREREAAAPRLAGDEALGAARRSRRAGGASASPSK